MSAVPFIACDIGGVVREMTTGDAMPGAADALARLQAGGVRLIFLSKAKPAGRPAIAAWVASQPALAGIPLEFCEEYGDKAGMAARHGVTAMIDDKTQVLAGMPPSVARVWFCAEDKKIAGTRKHQPALFATLSVCRSWVDVCALFAV